MWIPIRCGRYDIGIGWYFNHSNKLSYSCIPISYLLENFLLFVLCHVPCLCPCYIGFLIQPSPYPRMSRSTVWLCGTIKNYEECASWFWICIWWVVDVCSYLIGDVSILTPYEETKLYLKGEVTDRFGFLIHLFYFGT